MTIDVLKAMGITQPHAVERGGVERGGVERGGRPVDGAPFADMLDKQDHTPQQVTPNRKDPRPPVDEARQVAERHGPVDARDIGEVHDSDTQDAEPRSVRGESRTSEALKGKKDNRVDPQKTTPTASSQAPETVDTAGRDGVASTGPQAPPGETQFAAPPQVASLPLETPAEGQGALDEAAAPVQVSDPALTMIPAAPLPQIAAVSVAATTLTKVGESGSSTTPTITTPESATAAAAGAPSPGVDPASFTLGEQDPAQSANQGDDRVTVRVGTNTAAALSLATGPVISPDTTLAAMSTDEARPMAKASEPAPHDEGEAKADAAEATTPAKAAAPTANAASPAALNAGAKSATPENGAAPETKGIANAPASASQQAGAVADPALRPGEQAAATSSASSTGAVAHPRFAAPAQPPASQVAAKLAAQAGDGNRTYDIQLDPENLGRVRVHLDVGKDGAVTASISADRADTLAMLRSDSRTLQQALQDAGLSTTSGSLDFSLSGQRRDGGAWGSGYAGGRQAPLDDSSGDPRQAELPSPSAVPTGRPGRGSRAVDLKV